MSKEGIIAEIDFKEAAKLAFAENNKQYAFEAFKGLKIPIEFIDGWREAERDYIENHLGIKLFREQLHSLCNKFNVTIEEDENWRIYIRDGKMSRCIENLDVNT